MRSIDTATARRQLADLVSRVLYTKERITLTRYGKPCAVLVPIEDLAALPRRSSSPKTAGPLVTTRPLARSSSAKRPKGERTV